MNRLIELESQLPGKGAHPKRASKKAASKATAHGTKAQSFELAPRRAMAFAVSLPWTGAIDRMRARLWYDKGRTQFTTTSSTVKIDFKSAWSERMGRPDLFKMPTHVLITIYTAGGDPVSRPVRYPVDSPDVQIGTYSGLKTGENYVLDIQFDPSAAIPSNFPYLTGSVRVYVP